MSGERIVEIYLLGQRVYLRTSLPEDTVQEILTLLEKKEREITERRPLLPPMKVALLMLLQIAEDYVKIRKEFEIFREAVREKTARLEDILKEENGSLGCT